MVPSPFKRGEGKKNKTKIPACSVPYRRNPSNTRPPKSADNKIGNREDKVAVRATLYH